MAITETSGEELRKTLMTRAPALDDFAASQAAEAKATASGLTPSHGSTSAGLTPPTTAEASGRERILAVAAELFLARGYAEASLRTIADAVEMRPASIYHHFESKDALLTEILAIGMNAVTTAFDAATGSLPAEASGRQRLEAHVAGHLDALFANHAFTAAHVTVFPFVPSDVRRAAVPQRDEYEAQWTKLLDDIVPGMNEQALRLTRLALFGAMNSAVQWFDLSEGSIEELATTIVDTLWNGLGSLSQEGDNECAP